MVVIPLVALGAGRGPGESVATGRHGAPVLVRMAAAAFAAPAGPTGDGSTMSSSSSSSSSTTAPPTGAATSSTQPVHLTTRASSYAGVVSRRSTTTAHTSTTTRRATSTTAAPTTTTTAPRPSQTGPGSWYDAASGTCAHQSLPFGTVVSIVDEDNGATATCTVDDRGPYEDNRILDMAPDVFQKLAPLSQGIVNIKISW